MKYYLQIKATNIVTVRITEVISEKFNVVEGICIYVITFFPRKIKYDGLTDSNEHIYPTMKRSIRTKKSVKSKHLSLLFYKIFAPIYAFLPALQNLKYASSIEVRSSSSQPASHGFLNCFVSLLKVTSQ
jgi:hypothetical protein